VEEELRKKNAKEVKRLNERTNKKMKGERERESDGKVRRRILKNEKVKESRERCRQGLKSEVM
jgi:hypothetical protein